MGRVALDATLAQPFCGQTAVFSEPEKWWRHHCYGACKNSLHVIRQQPPTPRQDEKILFDSFFFFWFALFKNSSLLITHAQKINLLL